MKHIIITLLIILMMSSCLKDGQEVHTSNGEFKVEMLFEHEGCRVYRFVDAGTPLYWSICEGSVTDEGEHGTTIQTRMVREHATEETEE